ncbi:MAG: type II secretion system protein [Phycisphaerales bacterium]|nr:type II secretion system protein [Phycisphaerales bacterium]
MRCSSADRARRVRARRGFTLLEVLVALLIAAAGFGAVLAGLAGAQRASRRAEEGRRELEVARALVEEAFLGVLPADAFVGRAPEGGADEWQGQRAGVDWTVRVGVSATRGMNTAQEAPALGSRGGEDTLLEMRVIHVRAGRVELSTVQW